MWSKPAPPSDSGKRYAGEAEFRGFAEKLAREFSGLVVFARERLHLRLRRIRERFFAGVFVLR